MISVIINGAFGKMGKLAAETINCHPDFKLVATLGKKDNLASAIMAHQANIVVDLTRADVGYSNAMTIIENNAHPVIGTSGFTTKQMDELAAICTKKSLGGLIIPNFSISAVLMMQFAQTAAKFLTNVEIIESHHPEKYDAPSGTALKTAAMIDKQRLNKPSVISKPLYFDIPIHSVRLPGLLAKQEVIFGTLGETLSITHTSIDRQSFMPGLVLACQRVQSLSTLYYGLEHIL